MGCLSNKGWKRGLSQPNQWGGKLQNRAVKLRASCLVFDCTYSSRNLVMTYKTTRYEYPRVPRVSKSTNLLQTAIKRHVTHSRNDKKWESPHQRLTWNKNKHASRRQSSRLASVMSTEESSPKLLPGNVRHFSPDCNKWCRIILSRRVNTSINKVNTMRLMGALDWSRPSSRRARASRKYSPRIRNDLPSIIYSHVKYVSVVSYVGLLN